MSGRNTLISRTWPHAARRFSQGASSPSGTRWRVYHSSRAMMPSGPSPRFTSVRPCSCYAGEGVSQQTVRRTAKAFQVRSVCVHWSTAGRSIVRHEKAKQINEKSADPGTKYAPQRDHFDSGDWRTPESPSADVFRSFAKPRSNAGNRANSCRRSEGWMFDLGTLVRNRKSPHDKDFSCFE